VGAAEEKDLDREQVSVKRTTEEVGEGDRQGLKWEGQDRVGQQLNRGTEGLIRRVGHVQQSPVFGQAVEKIQDVGAGRDLSEHSKAALGRIEVGGSGPAAVIA